MNPNNLKFLQDNRHHWTALRDAQYLRHLDGNTRSEMQRVMAEEFRPGYTTDLWCSPCVSEMVTSLYREFEKWEAAQVPTPEPISMDVDPKYQEFIDLNNQVKKEGLETLATESNAIVKEDAVQIKANFPSHKKHPRR